MAQAAPEKQHGPLPLLIGMTGHRDLRAEDIAPLTQRVTEILTEVKTSYPYTPLVLLSPLAEGSDRLMARAALTLGIKLIVPLPMPRDVYEEDFETPESRAEFAALLEQAERVFVLPWLDGPPSGDLTAAQRRRQYALVGAYIVQHSQVFVALWDGIEYEDQAHKGGTAEIVRFRLKGVPPPYGTPRSALDAPETGPVYHIVAPRQQNPTPGLEPFTRRDLLPEGTTAESYARMCERLDLFNRDAVEHEADHRRAREESKDSLLTSRRNEPHPSIRSNMPASFRAMLDCYAVADTLAIHFARMTTHTMDRVFGSVFIAALCFNLFHSLPHPHPAGEAHGTPKHTLTARHGTDGPSGASGHEVAAAQDPALEAGHGGHVGGTAGDGTEAAAAEPGHDGKPAQEQADSGLGSFSEVAGAPWFLFIYMVIIGYNYMLHRRARNSDCQNKYQDYRSLAEGLRVQLFWRIAGLHDSVADHYLSKQESELQWIRNAIQVWDIGAVADDLNEVHSTLDPTARMAVSRTLWVREQRDYYARKARQEHEALENDERYIRRLLGVSAGLTIALMLVLTLPLLVAIPGIDCVKEHVENPWLHGLLMVTIVMSAVRAGLLHSYNEQRARAEHIKQFGRMSVLFDAADRNLEELLASGQLGGAGDLIRDLGEEALEENGDWVLLHRDRPLEVPHAA